MDLLTYFTFCIGTVTLTFDFLTSKILRSIQAIILWSVTVLGKMGLKFLNGNNFAFQVTLTLTYDLLTLKTKVFFCSIGAIILWSLEAVVEMELKCKSICHIQKDYMPSVQISWPTSLPTYWLNLIYSHKKTFILAHCYLDPQV